MNLLMYYSNFIGILGVGLVLLAYFLLQIGKMSQKSFIFSLLNFIGAVFLLISLFYHWNTASVVIEIAWLIISSYGMMNFFTTRIKKANDSVLSI